MEKRREEDDDEDERFCDLVRGRLISMLYIYIWTKFLKSMVLIYNLQKFCH